MLSPARFIECRETCIDARVQKIAEEEVQTIEEIASYTPQWCDRAYLTLSVNDYRYSSFDLTTHQGNHVSVPRSNAFLCLLCRGKARKELYNLCNLCYRLYNAIVRQGIHAIFQQRYEQNQDFICSVNNGDLGVILNYGTLPE